MNNNQDHVNRLLNMQKILQQVQKNKESEVVQEDSKIEVVEDTVKENEESSLPTKYISTKQLKLSVKEIASTTNFMDKLRITDNEETELKVTEKQANKIRREIIRLSTGTSSVAPLICKGSSCAFKTTCVTGDTIISGPKDKKMRDIGVGDTIYSFDLESNRIEKDTVTAKVNNGLKTVYLITTWYGKKLKVTSDHLVLTVNKKLDKFKWLSIDEGLKAGHKLVLDDIDDIDEELESIGDGFIDKILNIKRVGKEEVYDITVSKNSNFFANNINVHNCELYQQGVAPLGRACTPEETLIDYWLEKYKNEFNIQEDSITDLHAIGRLVTYDIYEMRLTRYLSEHDQTLLVDFISSYDEQNNPISNKATSAAWDTIDKIDRMRSKTLKELMATREAKTKLVQTVTQAHTNNSISALKEKFDMLIKQHSAVTVNGDAVEVR